MDAGEEKKKERGEDFEPEPSIHTLVRDPAKRQCLAFAHAVTYLSLPICLGSFLFNL